MLSSVNDLLQDSRNVTFLCFLSVGFTCSLPFTRIKISLLIHALLGSLLLALCQCPIFIQGNKVTLYWKWKQVDWNARKRSLLKFLTVNIGYLMQYIFKLWLLYKRSLWYIFLITDYMLWIIVLMRTESLAEFKGTKWRAFSIGIFWKGSMVKMSHQTPTNMFECD